MTTIKSVLYLLFFLMLFSNLNAQNLPNVQKTNLAAPIDIKIDGKVAEWHSGFQAYNNATEISYTISNDDHNLYLVVQATDHTIINKILGGGLTLTINKSDKNEFENGISITYPVLDIHNRVWVDVKNKPKIIAGSTASLKEADSVMNDNNKIFTGKSKFIMIKGIKNVDTLTSVYNNEGFKAKSLFDNEMVYTYELAVSLNQLGLDKSSAKFAYNIKLNGVNMLAIYKMYGFKTTMVAGMIVVTGYEPWVDLNQIAKNDPSSPSKVNTSKFTSPTDFWGEYTLAK